MKNKEAIEKLIEYFREHADFETLARALANSMIDIHRYATFDRLPLEEAESLYFRTKKNSEMLMDFIENGSKIKFHLKNVEKI